MIRLRGVHYRYPGAGDRWALRGVDLSVEKGEYLYVCGASGSGKSTLGMLLNGLIPHFFEGELLGTVEVNGLDTRRAAVSNLFQHVGLVLQNADAQLFNASVVGEIAFGLESLGLPAEEIDARLRQTARDWQIEGLLTRSPMALSGGEKRLVAVASVLCTDPSILVMDEPYAHLDWDGTRMIRQALRRIHRMGKTVIAIEHRPDGLMQDATRCLILEGGVVRWDGPPAEATEPLFREHLVPVYAPRDRQRRTTGGMGTLRIFNLRQRISGHEVLQGVSLEIEAGEAVAIIGRNGAGKTTLVKHLNGLLRPHGGEISVSGEALRGRDPSEMAAFVGLSFQNPSDQFFKFRVEDELQVGIQSTGQEATGWVEELEDLFLLEALLDRPPYRLSEGEKKRVAIASVLATRPAILILDEPTAGQDGRFRETLARLVTALQGRGVTTLVVTHDLEFAKAVADRWILLDGGRVLWEGAPDDPVMVAHLQSLGAVEPGEEPIDRALRGRI